MRNDASIPAGRRQIAEPVKSLTCQQDQIVERCCDEAAEPRQRGRGISRQDDRDGRAGNDLGALLAQHRRQPVGFARFEQSDPPSMQWSGHRCRRVITPGEQAAASLGLGQ
ncbi:MAG: hypothetical protein JO012_02715 [Hyphomicrobiales bacterium]|nr:hypothetical protein [Hyphomicrobiales bacterium]